MSQELRRIKEIWPSLSPLQTMLIALRARWFLISEAYVEFPYHLRRSAFNWSLYVFVYAHWVR